MHPSQASQAPRSRVGTHCPGPLLARRGKWRRRNHATILL